MSCKPRTPIRLDAESSARLAQLAQATRRRKTEVVKLLLMSTTPEAINAVGIQTEGKRDDD